MQENVAVSAEGTLIEKARARARALGTTLEDELRRWLESYAAEDLEAGTRLARHLETMKKLNHISTGGRKFTREEMNERSPATRGNIGVNGAMNRGNLPSPCPSPHGRGDA